uniref:C-C motif chemokine n=1 Tax=Salvator merianae TaxID=96440 RepID=A0A8D0BKC9_SALMN
MTLQASASAQVRRREERQRTVTRPSSPLDSMEILPAAVAFLLLTASFSLLLSLLAGIHDGPCCTRYSQKKIPKRVVKSYFYTSGNCPLPSVVFVFRNNLSTCTDPNVQWVKDLVKALDGE